WRVGRVETLVSHDRLAVAQIQGKSPRVSVDTEELLRRERDPPDVDALLVEVELRCFPERRENGRREPATGFDHRDRPGRAAPRLRPGTRETLGRRGFERRAVRP